MAEFYNAETLLEFVKQNTPHINGETTIKCVERAIKEAPTADVVEVKHGEWVYWQPDGTNHLWKCSVCNEAISTPMKFVADHIKYCEHCGAKMEGERKCDNGKQ
jgi:formylmethanofuran dehydrogenase subunit E